MNINLDFNIEIDGLPPKKDSGTSMKSEKSASQNNYLKLKEEAALREPQEILKEIKELDEESADILKLIKELL